MIVYITQNKIKNSLKPFGFKTFDPEVIELLNKAFQNYIKNTVTKHTKHTKSTKSTGTMQGGRVIMPMEYYGVQTSAYVENPAHSDMSVSDTWVRPPLEMNMVGMVGGAAKFALSLKSVESMLEELNLDIYKKNKVAKHLQSKLEGMFSEIIKKTSKASQDKTHLYARDLEAILDMKKYKMLI
jgi:hypothetical protein